MNRDFDLAVIGSGFSGSLSAMIASRTGLSVILIDRSSHPRFAIGEATSPLMNLIIEQLATKYDLPRLKPLSSWGEWQQNYPHIVGGIKRGVTCYRQETGIKYKALTDRSNQLMIAGSLNNDATDTNWLRSDVDYFLMQEAVNCGVEYIDYTELHSIELNGKNGGVLRGLRRGKPVKIRAGFIIDAGGSHGFLNKALNIPVKRFADYPATQALFSHFIGVHKCEDLQEYESSGLLSSGSESPPFLPDDSAIHHIFDGGWMWALRFNNSVVSAGISVTDSLAKELKLSEGESAWKRFLSHYPSIASQFAEAKAIREYTHIPNLSYRTTVAAGEGWAMLPSAASFTDPLFGPGMPMSLLGIERLGKLFEGGVSEINRHVAEYDQITLAEADHCAQFLSGCYSSFSRFNLFTSLSMIYFAAAGYCEMARRLGRNHLAQRFMAIDHTDFSSGASQLSKMPSLNNCFDSSLYSALVKKNIDSLNLTGLCNFRKRNWYSIDPDDVIASAHKLEMTSEDMQQFFNTSSWAKANSIQKSASLPPSQMRIELNINLNAPILSKQISDEQSSTIKTLDENEADHIKKVLQQTGGRIAGPRGAASILGVPPSTLRSKMKKLGM